MSIYSNPLENPWAPVSYLQYQWALAEDYYKFKTRRIADYVRIGIETDGAHHKQWCLMQIAKELELQGIDTLDEGTAP